MLTVSKQLAFRRWDEVPEILREALASDQTVAILQRICEGEHVSDDKQRTISRIVGYVLLGFMHPEEVAKEIQSALNFNIDLAQRIADALNERLFKGLRFEIDKVYAPPAATVQAPAGGLTPSRIREIMPPAPAASPLSVRPAVPGEAPGEGPVMLHRESLFTPIGAKPTQTFDIKPQSRSSAGVGTPTAASGPAAQPTRPPVPQPAASGAYGGEFGVTKKPVAAPAPAQPKPQAVAPLRVNAASGASRVVHYSESAPPAPREEEKKAAPKPASSLYAPVPKNNLPPGLATRPIFTHESSKPTAPPRPAPSPFPVPPPPATRASSLPMRAGPPSAPSPKTPAPPAPPRTHDVVQVSKPGAPPPSPTRMGLGGQAPPPKPGIVANLYKRIFEEKELPSPDSSKLKEQNAK